MKKTLTEIEGNKLIDEFMGWKKSDFSKEFMEPPPIEEGEESEEFSAYRISAMKYHTSWDLLMRVYEKVSNVFQNYKELTNRKGKFREMEPLYRKIQEEIIHVNIKGAHEWLVQFIAWFNTQTPTT